MVERIGISLEKKLLDRFDGLVERRGWPNRSEAIRDLIRAALVDEEWEGDAGDQDAVRETVAAVVLVYDHENPDVAARLTDIQHENHRAVVSTLHVHLDAHNCLEVIVLRGPGPALRRMGDALATARGVRLGRFLAATSGADLA